MKNIIHFYILRATSIFFKYVLLVLIQTCVSCHFSRKLYPQFNIVPVISLTTNVLVISPTKLLLVKSTLIFCFFSAQHVYSPVSKKKQPTSSRRRQHHYLLPIQYKTRQIIKQVKNSKYKIKYTI